jgi:alpha-D-glucose phosphate-specific phosphoglucomutase
MIKFGTDGWRAIIAEEFTFHNVELVSQAIANYIHKVGQEDQGLVIGYDNRFLSEKFAEIVGEVMLGNGIPVYITAGACPTPVTAFAILEKKAAGAIMLTASHNPSFYNGLKFIPDYAGPAIPEITNEIEKQLQQVMAEPVIKKLSISEAEILGTYHIIHPKDQYLEHIKGLLNLRAIMDAKLEIVIDPMYGAGIGYLDELFKPLNPKVIHNYRDTMFGGSLPEPTLNNLRQMQNVVKELKCDIGLALDGDADRFGIIDGNGNYITPNQVLALVYYHLLTRRGIKGKAARTVATTHMLDRMAKAFDYEVLETAVGFKYIGQMMRENDCIIGGEESGGLSIKGHIPEKDGILACALMAEIMAMTNKSLTENLKELETLYGTVVSERLDIHTSQDVKVKVLEELKGFAPKKVANLGVIDKITKDGVKLLLEDGSFVLIRTSGTEPLFRIYTETYNDTLKVAIQKDVREKLGI